MLSKYKKIAFVSLLLAAPLAMATSNNPIIAKKVEFVTLGTGGGPLIRTKRSEPANAVVVGKSVYLFDVGSGVEKQMVRANLKLENVRAIFISHHHIDHDADLGQLIGSRWMFNHYKPLPIIGPPGTVQMVDDLVAADRPVELAPIGGGPKGKAPIASTVGPRDLASTMNKPTEVYKDENIRVLAITNTHYHYPKGSKEAKFSRSYSYRIETPARTYVFTGDTGPSKHVEILAKGADVLVSEVIDLDKMLALLKRAKDLPAAAFPIMIKHMEEDHLTPKEVGKLAERANVKKVVLTHLAPGMDNEVDMTGYTKGIKPTYQGPVVIANDLDQF